MGKKFCGFGYKVCAASGKRLWGGDDGVYRANPSLQENLPRGCVIVKSKEGKAALAIFGNRKFYGKTSGDDDESDLTSEAIKRGTYSKFLISNKANGESCHVVRNRKQPRGLCKYLLIIFFIIYRIFVHLMIMFGLSEVKIEK